MKATGTIRRIDDLGRIVIPREVRRVLNIEEGDPMEICVDTKEGVVFVKKYDPHGDAKFTISEAVEKLEDALDELGVGESEMSAFIVETFKNHLQKAAEERL